MKVEQLYTGCLAEAAYYIESNGEAAIIDPLRESAPYLKLADEAKVKIKYIFETHFHADFVSGHIDLARKTGAKIVFGPTASPNYDVIIAKDEQIFEIGNVKIKVLHTPGHTMESVTYLLIDEKGNDHAIFTGDTLFLGDVGRPDLAIKSDLTKEDLAAMLFTSLRERIMPLSDSLIVYPAHGAGSSCGKNMSSETVDTLGNQKRTNYALRPDMTKEEFVKEVLTDILPPPQYFPLNAMMNKNGYESFDDVMHRGDRALNVEEFKELMQNEEYIVLDTRHETDYGKGHIPGSWFIGLDGNFAMWVGVIIRDIKQKIILVTEKGREGEALLRLSRVGYDNARGYLEGGFEAWVNHGEASETERQISAVEFAKLHCERDIITLDVRKPGEFEAERVSDAISFPLDFLFEHLNDLDKNKTYYLHCAGGYRSMSTIAILKNHGFKNLVNVNGGFDAIKLTDVPKTEYVCPSTLV
jgi:glyoxylase-like metal-dependent hydrolase (beta-lactamase superfamily II)/rhodanese-related sulfurtransferase